jgi:hypothetical protein
MPNSASADQELSSKILPMGGRQPIGFFDAITPSSITWRHKFVLNLYSRKVSGWAVDPDFSSWSIWVHIYGKPGGSNSGHRTEFITSTFANLPRKDVNISQHILGNHGWSVTLPEEWDVDKYRDKTNICKSPFSFGGSTYTQCNATFYAYGVDITKIGLKRLKHLSTSPKVARYQQIY